MNAPMTLHGVGRRYGLTGPWVLRDVDLEVPARSLLRIEGGNGSGKSTLLRLLAGVDAPSAGRVSDRPHSAYVPERFPVALPFTALGYLTHLARVHGLRGRAAPRAALEWLERFGAGEFARMPLAELSKGTAQKVAVAQALLARPGLLVLDEAWTGLDPRAGAVLDRAIVELVTDGGTVVFVDHDAARLADVGYTSYQVVNGGVERPVDADAFASGGEGPGSGPRVRVVAEGPPGTHPPPVPPGVLTAQRGVDGAAFVAPEPSLDALLRALLTASPPWHIRSVHGVFDPQAPSAGPTDGATAKEPDSGPGEHEETHEKDAGGAMDAVADAHDPERADETADHTGPGEATGTRDATGATDTTDGAGRRERAPREGEATG